MIFIRGAALIFQGMDVATRGVAVYDREIFHTNIRSQAYHQKTGASHFEGAAVTVVLTTGIDLSGVDLARGTAKYGIPG